LLHNFQSKDEVQEDKAMVLVFGWFFWFWFLFFFCLAEKNPSQKIAKKQKKTWQEELVCRGCLVCPAALFYIPLIPPPTLTAPRSFWVFSAFTSSLTPLLPMQDVRLIKDSLFVACTKFQDAYEIESGAFSFERQAEYKSSGNCQKSSFLVFPLLISIKPLHSPLFFAY
jgi:hypothetical protein